MKVIYECLYTPIYKTYKDTYCMFRPNDNYACLHTNTLNKLIKKLNPQIIGILSPCHSQCVQGNLKSFIIIMAWPDKGDVHVCVRCGWSVNKPWSFELQKHLQGSLQVMCRHWASLLMRYKVLWIPEPWIIVNRKMCWINKRWLVQKKKNEDTKTNKQTNETSIFPSVFWWQINSIYYQPN